MQLCTPYHQRCWLLNRMLMTCWKVSLLFSPEVLDFQQEGQIWTSLTIEHFSTLKQSILNVQCRLRAWRPQASNKGLQPCPLRTEISPVSLNLLMMLCTVDYVICKAFAIWCWGTLFLKYSTIFLCTLSQIGEPLPILTSERLCLSKGPFTPGHFIRVFLIG